jgi:hypothetical protein
MKRWARKHPVHAGLCIIPWLAGFAAPAGALELAPATSSPAISAAGVTGQAVGAPDALALLLWAPLLLMVLLSVATLALMIWRQNADTRGRRRMETRPRPAAPGEAASGAKLPAALALSSASILAAPSVGDWPRDWPQAARPGADSAALQRDAAETGPVLASAAKR